MPDRIPGADPGVVLRAGRTVKSAVLADLTGKGYSEVALDSADFAVNLTCKVVPKTDVTDWGYGGYYGGAGRRGWWGAYPYYGSDVTVDSYEEGTLIIEVYEVASKRMVWVGWGTARRKESGVDTERLTATVTEILSSFPAAGGSSS